jgi:Ser/Thr protein kinase RdoA (MazF antagonist)
MQALVQAGIWEEPFEIQTDQGRLFAKRFRRQDRQTEAMLQLLQLSERLRDAGIPSPVIRRTKEGALLAAIGGERYLVTEWADGITYQPGELPLSCAAPMGALLGRLHRLLGRAAPNGTGSGPADAPAFTWRPPHQATRDCRDLLARYADRPEPFAAAAREVLTEQIRLLEALPPDFHEGLPAPQIQGGCFNSFWVEQVLFRQDGEVAALVDWTDGAGKNSYWAQDIWLGLHLSLLEGEALTAFVSGYQRENPLPESEWRAVGALLTYGNLASTNFLTGWLDNPIRRAAGREEITVRWHRAVPRCFRDRETLMASLLAATGNKRPD